MLVDFFFFILLLNSSIAKIQMHAYIQRNSTGTYNIFHEQLPLDVPLPVQLSPTQPPALCGTGNEYRPKCGDALRLGSKGRMAHSILG